MKIVGPENAKIEGRLPENGGDNARKEAEMEQNPVILDKCRYRRAVALLKMGEAARAVECLEAVGQQGEEVQKLLE